MYPYLSIGVCYLLVTVQKVKGRGWKSWLIVKRTKSTKAGKIGLERFSSRATEADSSYFSKIMDQEAERSYLRPVWPHGLPKNDLLPSVRFDILRVLGLHNSTEPGHLPS